MKYKYITIEDAIETCWMILAGLGYKKEENYELRDTVEKVFHTTPHMTLEAPEV